MSTANTPQLASAQRKPTINRERSEPTSAQRQHASAASNIASAIARAIILLLIATTSGCVSYEELLYFRENAEEQPTFETTRIENQPALEIQRNDLLSITVNSFDQELAAPFNLLDSRMAANAGNGQGSPFITYQVDKNGTIDFPVLGTLDVEGKTIQEAKRLIREQLLAYLKDPVVNVRLVNFRISVLGEVNRPGTFTINTERITVLEALGMAGDLTAYSNRSNLLVIREQNAERTFGYINLQEPDFLTSPYFYLQQGDVLYVEPAKAKEAVIRDRPSETIPWVTAGLQVIATAVALIVAFRK